MAKIPKSITVEVKVKSEPLNSSELMKLAEKFNSGGRFGNLKEIHAALMRYNLYLVGQIKKDEL